jgi:hypothetical protein
MPSRHFRGGIEESKEGCHTSRLSAMRKERDIVSQGSQVRGSVLGVVVGCFAATVLLMQLAVAQQQTVPPSQLQAVPPSEPAIPPAVTQPKPESRGFFEAIGRWFDEGTAGFRSHVAGARTSIDEFNQRAEETRKSIGDSAAEISKNAVGAGVAAADVTRDAVGAVAKLPMARVVQGRERCMTAPNGAPDCLAAAEALCRKQGFTTGKSVDFTSAESCPARTYLGGKQSENECTTVTFISRAMCQ